MKFKMKSITGKEVMVGEIKGVVFIKKIRYAKHYFRKADALGIDVSLLDAIIKKGILRIVLIDKDTGKRYEAPVERFLQKGWKYPKKKDKYYGKFQPQHFMSLNRWTVKSRDGDIIRKGKEMEAEIREKEEKQAAKAKKEEKRRKHYIKIRQKELFNV